MDDQRIVELYWERSEQAISETQSKYGSYCYSIAYNILNNNEDAEESVNDTYNDAWNSIPPHRPSILSTFLGKITRRISIDRWRKHNAEKRGGGEMPLVLDELQECVADEKTVTAEQIRAFLDTPFTPYPSELQNEFTNIAWVAEMVGESLTDSI